MIYLVLNKQVYVIKNNRLHICSTDITANQLLDEYYILRKKIFIDLRGWKLSDINGREIDEYDTDQTAYLISYDENLNKVIGGLRLLPTTGPFMINNTFLKYITNYEGFIPNEKVWECSRFCFEERKSDEFGKASIRTIELFIGMIEFGIALNLSSILTMTLLGFEHMFDRCGWKFERIVQDSFMVDEYENIIGTMPISTEMLKSVRQKAGIDYPVIMPTNEAA